MDGGQVGLALHAALGERADGGVAVDSARDLHDEHEPPAAVTVRVRAGKAEILDPLERLDELLAGRSRVAARYREALEGIEGLGLPCPDAGGDRRGWFVFVVQVPPGIDRDATVRALAERGVQSKPYLPAIHLMSYYRERFGHRPGEFPVCEDVAARSLALPFFPEMSEGQVARVAEALQSALT